MVATSASTAGASMVMESASRNPLPSVVMAGATGAPPSVRTLLSATPVPTTKSGNGKLCRDITSSILFLVRAELAVPSSLSPHRRDKGDDGSGVHMYARYLCRSNSRGDQVSDVESGWTSPAYKLIRRLYLRQTLAHYRFQFFKAHLGHGLFVLRQPILQCYLLLGRKLCALKNGSRLVHYAESGNLPDY